MRISLHPLNPQSRLIGQAAECLSGGGVVIYPTDSSYALGCDIRAKNAVERICKIKNIRPERAQFTCLCADLKMAGQYVVQTDTAVYKLMRQALPGPYTFILKAADNVPRHFQSKRRSIGVRVSSHPVVQALLERLGGPLFSLSLPTDENGAIYTDPERIDLQFSRQVDMILEAGEGNDTLTTVLDVSDPGQIVLLRAGAGDIAELGISVMESEEPEATSIYG